MRRRQALLDELSQSAAQHRWHAFPMNLAHLTLPMLPFHLALMGYCWLTLSGDRRKEVPIAHTRISDIVGRQGEFIDP